MRSLLAACLLLSATSASADDPKPAAKAGKTTPLDAVEGYKRHTIEGFTLLVSQAVLDADASGYERKPLDVLELELKTVSRLMTPRALGVLRKLLVWVEWDERQPVSNGRDGTAVAVYYGGHQLSLVRKGMHPLKSKSVTILSMKTLTAAHQPKDDAGGCVLLHEIAHAVHDNLLGWENPAIKAAHRQAMERKLYDRSQYVSTNEAEFFAELTCAYFDQLEYYPRTREQLKKHDPASFKMLDAVWGAAARKPNPTTTAVKPKVLAESNGSDEFDLSVTLADVRLGEAVHGPKLAADDLKGKPVLFGFWGGEEAAVLRKLAEVHEELGPYGLRVVAGPGYATERDDVMRELIDRDVPFTGLDRLFVRVKGTNMLRTERPPHVLLLDADGTCVFRGSGYEVLPHARAAVGRMILAGIGIKEHPKGIAPVTDALTDGRPFLDVLEKLTPLVSSRDAETAAAAKSIQTTLLAPGQEALAEAQRLAKTDPLGAFVLAEPLPRKYKGTPIEAKASALLVSVKQTNAVGVELRARVVLEQVKKLDAALSGQAGSFAPTDPQFQARNAPALAQMRKLVDQMRRNYPKAPATAAAGKVARSYGVQ
jgi:hypothetical protein